MSILNWIVPKQGDSGQQSSGGYSQAIIDSLTASTKTVSGERVSATSALSLPTYYACIKVISEDIAKLPIGVFERTEDGRKPLRDGPIQELLNFPNENMSSFSFKETIQHYALGWGNGYADIVFNERGDPVEMNLIHPSRVRPFMKNGKVFYEVTMEAENQLNLGPFSSTSGKRVILPANEMLHIHGLSGNGIVGYSMARIIAETVGWGTALRKYGAAFFGNGATYKTILTHPGSLSKQAAERLKDSIEEGNIGAENAHQLKVLEEGMTLEQISIPPNEAQFIESMNFSTEEIVKFFRVPLSKVQHLLKANFNTLEMQNQEYVTDTLSSWFKRWEQELDRKLILPSERTRIFTRVDAKQLIKGDLKTQALFSDKMIKNGTLSVNEVREDLDRNRIDDEGADAHLTQLNQGSLENVADPEDDPDNTETTNNMDERVENQQLSADFDKQYPVLIAQFEKSVSKESKAINRILEKHSDSPKDQNKEMTSFYASYRRELHDNLEPIAKVIGADYRELTRFCFDYGHKLHEHKEMIISNEPEVAAQNALQTFKAYILKGQE